MMSSNGVCLMLMAVTCIGAISCLSRTQITNNPKFQYRPGAAEVSDYLERQRCKRSLRTISAIGEAAIHFLLRGAKPLTVQRQEKFRRFSKRGNFITALGDFSKLKPSYVFRLTKRNEADIVLEGKVGDRRVFVRKHGEDGNPTLDIIVDDDRKKGWAADRVIYYKREEH